MRRPGVRIPLPPLPTPSPALSLGTCFDRRVVNSIASAKTSCHSRSMRFVAEIIIIAAVISIGWNKPFKEQAISPPPDGGYPGGNTAEGQNALFSVTSGRYNTAVGFFSLRINTTGQLNTAAGAGTLLANIGDENTAIGAGALLSNTTGGL